MSEMMNVPVLAGAVIKRAILDYKGCLRHYQRWTNTGNPPRMS